MGLIIRRLVKGDRPALAQLMRRFLQYNFENGGDYNADGTNVNAFTDRLIVGAIEGEPCIIADDGGSLVGFCVALGVHGGFGLAHVKVCWAMGTYVEPPYRRQSLARDMHEARERLAREAGYDRMDGVMLGVGLQFATAMGWQSSGSYMRKELR